MTKTDFLEGLREGLNGEVPASVIQETIEYYNRYIQDSIAEGKTEEQVLEELGPVQLIVKSIVDANAGAGRYDSAQRQYTQKTEEQEQEERAGFHTEFTEDGKLDLKYGRFSLNSWYGRLLLILLAVLIVALIIVLAIGLVMVAWYLLPVIAVIALVIILANIFLKNR